MCYLWDTKRLQGAQTLTAWTKSRSTAHLNMVMGEHAIYDIRIRDHYGSSCAQKILGMARSSLHSLGRSSFGKPAAHRPFEWDCWKLLRLGYVPFFFPYSCCWASSFLPVPQRQLAKAPAGSPLPWEYFPVERGKEQAPLSSKHRIDEMLRPWWGLICHLLLFSYFCFILPLSYYNKNVILWQFTLENKFTLDDYLTKKFTKPKTNY